MPCAPLCILMDQHSTQDCHASASATMTKHESQYRTDADVTLDFLI